jgi:hypothetical protein
MNHEEEFVRAFIVPTKRERYLEMVRKPKKRIKFLAELAHFNSLNPKYEVKLRPRDQNPTDVAALLRSKGAGPTCQVTAEWSLLDGREMKLEEALKETIGAQMGTIISCVPGKLAFFENEDYRVILQR